MLKSLTLHQFRYIKPGTKLMFTEHFNVLLGRNGTGKTTLLDLISMVLRSDFSTLREEEFDIEYEFTHEEGSGQVRFVNQFKPISTAKARTIREILRAKPPRLQPRMGIKIHLDRIEKKQEVDVEVEGASLRWRKSGGRWVKLDAIDVFEVSLFEVLSDVILDTHDGHAIGAYECLGGFNRSGQWAYRFDESLGVFESITERDTSRAQKPGHVPPIQLQVRFALPTDEHWDPGARGPAFISHRYKPVPPEVGRPSTAVEPASDSAIARFSELTGINKKMSMSLTVQRSWWEEGVDCLWWYLGPTEFLFSGVRGSEFSHHFLSYGQKRLLAFLYYLDANDTFVIADELVNGMHHDWIRACLDQIGDRQSFLTSQNPLMLDYLPLESVEQVQKSFIQCRSEVVGETTQLVWSNLAKEDAEELFADYQVGIQHVGEILRVRGLW